MSPSKLSCWTKLTLCREIKVIQNILLDSMTLLNLYFHNQAADSDNILYSCTKCKRYKSDLADAQEEIKNLKENQMSAKVT